MATLAAYATYTANHIIFGINHAKVATEACRAELPHVLEKSGMLLDVSADLLSLPEERVCLRDLPQPVSGMWVRRQEGDIHISSDYDKSNAHLQQVHKQLLAAIKARGADHHGRSRPAATPQCP